MFLHKRSSILGILGVIVTLLLIILFSSSNIRDQARVISSFAQAQCSKECNVDDKNSCGSPFVCKPKCNGNICSFKAGTCEFPECPDGQKCGCTRPTIPPWKGHENYPAPGYANLHLNLNFNSPYYHPEYHLIVKLEQSVKDSSGKSIKASTFKKINVKRGQNLIVFENVPVRLTKLTIYPEIYDKDNNFIEDLDYRDVKIKFDGQCKSAPKDPGTCDAVFESNTNVMISGDFEIVAKLPTKDNLFIIGRTNLINTNREYFVKIFICNLDLDIKCKNPTSELLKIVDTKEKDIKFFVKKLTPGRKRLYFDTKYIYDENQKILFPVSITNLSYYSQDNLNRIDWREKYDFFVSAISGNYELSIDLKFFDKNISTKATRFDEINLNFIGRPQRLSYANLIPCGFVDTSGTVECFEKYAILKQISTSRVNVSLPARELDLIGWKLKENLYDENGKELSEKFEYVANEHLCLKFQNIDSNICVFDPLRSDSYEIYTRFNNNIRINKNIWFQYITLAHHDEEMHEVLKKNYRSDFLKVSICDSKGTCEKSYPLFLKLIGGGLENGDFLELPGVENISGLTVKLDDSIYNSTGQVVSKIPKDWVIETECNSGEVDSASNSCKFSPKEISPEARFAISFKKKQPAQIKTQLQILKKAGEEISTLKREICATRAAYLCRDITSPTDFTLQIISDDDKIYSDKSTLVQFDDFQNQGKKSKFLEETQYFVKYKVVAKSGNIYEKVEEISNTTTNSTVFDLTKSEPIKQKKKTKRKIKVYIHDYFLPSIGKNLFAMIDKNVDYAKDLASQTAKALSLSNNPVDFEIIDYEVLSSFPKFSRNNDETLVENLFITCADGMGRKNECEQIPIILGNLDYEELEKEHNLCEEVNKGEFDELWHVNMPYTPLGEDDIFGPYPININGITTKISKCDKNVPTLGIDILRSVGDAMHSFGHRAESLKYVFDDGNDWASPPKTIFEEFILSDFTENLTGKSHVYSGCGSIHFPPNVNKKSLDSYQTTQSICDNFLTFDPPNEQLSRKPRVIDCFEWGCSGEGYYTWWLSHLPNGKGKDEKGRMNNWWQYVIYTENLVKDSAIAKLMVLDQNKNGIFDQNDYDTFVGQTKTVPLKNQNSILDQNNDQKLTTTDFSFYKSKIGTELPEITHKHDHIFKFPR